MTTATDPTYVWESVSLHMRLEQMLFIESFNTLVVWTLVRAWMLLRYVVVSLLGDWKAFLAPGTRIPVLLVFQIQVGGHCLLPVTFEITVFALTFREVLHSRPVCRMTHHDRPTGVATFP
jgi:hypothetical protein